MAGLIGVIIVGDTGPEISPKELVPEHDRDDPAAGDIPPRLTELASTAISEALGGQSEVTVPIGRIVKIAFEEAAVPSEDFKLFLGAIKQDPREASRRRS